MEAKELTVSQATELLAAWGTTREQLDWDRNELIRTAYRSGIGKSRIAQLMGLNRGTVDNVLRRPRP